MVVMEEVGDRKNDGEKWRREEIYGRLVIEGERGCCRCGEKGGDWRRRRLKCIRRGVV